MHIKLTTDNCCSAHCLSLQNGIIIKNPNRV